MWDRPIKVHVIKEEDTITGRGGVLDRVLFSKHFWTTMGGPFLIFFGFVIYPFSGLLSIIMIGLGIFLIYKKFQRRRR